MDEREIYAERWHGAIREWARPLRFAWGMLDPVATPDVLGGLRELRPGVEVTEFADLGHYPQLEDPPRLAAALRDAIAASERLLNGRAASLYCRARCSVPRSENRLHRALCSWGREDPFPDLIRS